MTKKRISLLAMTGSINFQYATYFFTIFGVIRWLVITGFKLYFSLINFCA